MEIDTDRIAILIGRLVLQAESAGQQIERLTKELAESKDKKDGD